MRGAVDAQKGKAGRPHSEVTLPGLPGNSSAWDRLIRGTAEVGSTLARLLTDTSTERDNVLPGSFILPREAMWKRP